MNTCELTVGITAAANAIARGLSDDELSLAAAAFTQLGDTLATISVQRAMCRPKESGTNAVNASASA